MRRRIHAKLKHINQSGHWPSGNPRLYFRPKGHKGVALPDAPQDHPVFLTRYAALLSAHEGAEADLRLTARKGSIAEAVQHYLRSDEWRSLSEGTRRHRRPVLDDIVERYGRAALRTLEARHIRSDLRDLRGHPFNRRLKVWRGLLAYAVEEFDLRANPAASVAAKKLPGTEGHAQWTEADAAKFRAKWPIDTAQRLAFELLQWTGARISDAVTLTERQIEGGFLTYRQGKTGGEACPPMTEAAAPLAQRLSADLRELRAALDARPDRHVTIMTTAQGAPRSVKAASAWFSKAARAAGIEGKGAHGLRKRRTALLIEAGATRDQVKAWTGHESDSMVAHYAKAHDRKNTLRGTGAERQSSNFPRKFQQKGEKP